VARGSTSPISQSGSSFASKGLSTQMAKWSRAKSGYWSRQTRIECGSAVSSSRAPPNLKISGLTIATDANTRFNVHSLTNLRVGDVVQVEGSLGADGTVLARSIEKLARDEEEEDEVEFESVIQSVTPPTLTVADKTVLTDSATRIRRGDRTVLLSDLQVGERVEVKGKRLADGSILATRVEVEDN